MKECAVVLTGFFPFYCSYIRMEMERQAAQLRMLRAQRPSQAGDKQE